MKNREKKSVRSAVLIRAGIEEMSAEAVRERIGEARYRLIRHRDPHPLFVELVVGHEGWSTGKLMTGRSGRRPARKRWTRERIRELAERLRWSTPVYVSHAEGGRSGDARQSVGEIVAAAERWMKGALSATGIAYLRDPKARDRVRSGELDTCSLEAEVECHREPGAADESWVVDAVRKITGVALGNSRVQAPGFAGAGVLALVEEFESDEGRAEEESPETPQPEAKVPREPARGRSEAERRIRELEAELGRYRREEERERRARKAEEAANRILSLRRTGPEEREVILSELRARPPEENEGFEEAVKARVEGELKKIARLRELWAGERIATPPEREAGQGPGANPLIPRPRGR